MNKWHICRIIEGGMVPIEEAGEFTGPGKAWRWLSEQGRASEFGRTLFAVRGDGLRPRTFRKGELV